MDRSPEISPPASPVRSPSKPPLLQRLLSKDKDKDRDQSPSRPPSSHHHLFQQRTLQRSSFTPSLPSAPSEDGSEEDFRDGDEAASLRDFTTFETPVLPEKDMHSGTPQDRVLSARAYFISLLLYFAVMTIVWFVPRPPSLSGSANTFTDNGWFVFAVFIATIFVFCALEIPPTTTVLFGLGLAMITTKMSTSQALFGYSYEACWSILGSFLFAEQMSSCGLARRASLMIVQKLGHSILGLGYSIFLFEALLALVIPSGVARSAAVVAPLVYNVSLSLGSRPIVNKGWVADMEATVEGKNAPLDSVPETPEGDFPEEKPRKPKISPWRSLSRSARNIFKKAPPKAYDDLEPMENKASERTAPLLTKPRLLGHTNDPTPGVAGAYLTLCAVHGNTLSSSMFSSASVATAEMQEFGQKIFGVSIGWGEYLGFSIVPAVICLVLLPVLLYYIEKPTITDVSEAQERVKLELGLMGKWSRKEIITAACALVVVCLSAVLPYLEAFHNTLVVSLWFGLSLLLLSRTATIDSLLAKTQAWDVFLWLGGILSFIAFLSSDGENVFGVFTDNLQQSLTSTNAIHGWSGLLLVAVIFFGSMFFFTTTVAHTISLGPGFMSIAQAIGAPGKLSILVLCFMSNLSGSLTHYAMGASYIYHGMYYLTTRRFLTVGICVSVFFLVVWLGPGLLYWYALGAL